MKKKPFPIKIADPANIKFDQQSIYSENFEDIYFQPGIGMDEKKHVFLKGNNLPEKWLDKSNFCIAETGFGTGLNFLNTLQLWHKTQRPDQHLHYISCELQPLTINQLKKSLINFPELKDYISQLLKKYPSILLEGFHRIHFEEYNITLTLMFSDCLTTFNHLNASIDAWFLDGFSPSKNEDMWSNQLFKSMANISHIGTTAATYTVARKIREGLISAGFSVNKTKGFGQKREMLRAVYTHQQPTIGKLPWAQTYDSSTAESITILGAGIAGLTLADKLQKYGKSVVLIDKNKHSCMETSGNPQAMIMPSLDLNDSYESQFYLSAFLYAIEYYSKQYYHQVGVFEYAFDNKQRTWHENFHTKFNLPTQLIIKQQNGTLHPLAGWLDTQSHALNIQNDLENYKQAHITNIIRKNSQWHLYQNNELIHTCKVLVLANGMNVCKLLSQDTFPLIPKYGEISFFKPQNIENNVTNTQNILLNKGYILPQWQGEQIMGATFEHVKKQHFYNPALTSTKHWQKNTALWNNTPFEDCIANFNSHKSRAGIRVTTPDHMPICGPVIDQKQFKIDYHDICHGKHWKQYPLPKFENNLYIFTGLGSKGYTSAPILAEFLSNQLLGQPQVLNTILQKKIHPNRFLLKELLKK